MDEILTIEHFKLHIGKAVLFKGTPIILTIDRVEGDAGPPPAGYVRTPFVVIFKGSSEAGVMAAGSYDCEIEDGPTYNLFVNPIHTPERSKQEYQSAFN
jgi:hypothetical protein